MARHCSWELIPCPDVVGSKVSQAKDFIAITATCKSWKNQVPKDKHPQFNPVVVKGYIMPGNGQVVTVFAVSNKEFRHIIPDMFGRATMFMGSGCGHILCSTMENYRIRLSILNPFANVVVHLPDIPSFFKYWFLHGFISRMGDGDAKRLFVFVYTSWHPPGYFGKAAVVIRVGSNE